MSIVDQETVRHLYIDEQLSIRSIAATLHVNPRTVHDALIRGRIPRRRPWEQHATMAAEHPVRGQLDESTLRRLYVVENHSLHEIADTLAVSATTVRQALVDWDIPRRGRGRPGRRGERYAPGGEQEYEEIGNAESQGSSPVTVCLPQNPLVVEG